MFSVLDDMEFTSTVVGVDIQVLSGVLRTKMVCEPAAKAAKVGDA